jgi:hypothetical protein
MVIELSTFLLKGTGFSRSSAESGGLERTSEVQLY